MILWQNINFGMHEPNAIFFSWNEFLVNYFMLLPRMKHVSKSLPISKFNQHVVKFNMSPNWYFPRMRWTREPDYETLLLQHYTRPRILQFGNDTIWYTELSFTFYYSFV